MAIVWFQQAASETDTNSVLALYVHKLHMLMNGLNLPCYIVAWTSHCTCRLDRLQVGVLLLGSFYAYIFRNVHICDTLPSTSQDCSLGNSIGLHAARLVTSLQM